MFDHHACNDQILDRQHGWIGPLDHPGRQAGHRFAVLVQIRAVVEQRAFLRVSGDDGEHGHAAALPRGDERRGRRHHGVIAAQPERVGAARHERSGRLGDAVRVVHVGLEDGDAELPADAACGLREDPRVRLGRIPDDPDRLQTGKHAPRHAERVARADVCADANQVPRMIQRSLVSDSDAGRLRCGDDAEDVRHAPCAVRVGHRLQRGRPQRHNQIELAARQLPGNRVGHAHVGFSLVPGQHDPAAAIAEAKLPQTVDESARPVFEGRGRRVPAARRFVARSSRSRSLRRRSADRDRRRAGALRPGQSAAHQGSASWLRARHHPLLIVVSPWSIR